MQKKKGRRRKERIPPTHEQRVKALYDYWTFIDIIGFHGGASAFAPCHKDMEAFVHRADASDKQLILMPRGHLKSTVLSVGETLWDIYKNPDIRIYVGTATRSLATAFVREVKSYLEDAWLQENVWHVRPHIPGRLVPTMERVGKQRRLERDDTEAEDKKVVWRNDAIQVIRRQILKEPTVTAGSVGSTATGFHYDKLVLDDIVTFDNCNTDSKRDRLFSWVYDLESVLDPSYLDEELRDLLFEIVRTKQHRKLLEKAYTPGGTVRVIGTLYERDDYYQYILKNLEILEFELYQRNIYVNGKNADDGYIWAEKFNKKYEMRLRASMTARRFYSQYLNEILNPEDLVISWDSINWFIESSVKVQENGWIEILFNVPNKDTKEKHLIRPILAIDPAATANKNSDYTAIGVGGVDRWGNMFVFDLVFGKWTFSQWCKEMYRLLDKWYLKGVVLETVNFQKTLVELIRQQFPKYRPISLMEYKPSTRIDKKDRIETAIEPKFSNGLLYCTRRLANNAELKDIVNFFPKETVKDDPLDVLAIISEVAKAARPNATVNPMRKHINKRYGGYR